MVLQTHSQCLLAIFLFSADLLVTSGHEGHDDHVKISADYNENALHDSGIVHDTEHIKEHYQGQVELNENMTFEEQEFHYFHNHDIDGDGALDGLEIYHAIEHQVSDHSTLVDALTEEDFLGKTADEIKEMKRKKSQEVVDILANLTDTVLKDDDLNDNGYLTYVEYKLSQAIRAAKEKLEEYVDAL